MSVRRVSQEQCVLSVIGLLERIIGIDRKDTGDEKIKKIEDVAKLTDGNSYTANFKFKK